MKCSEFHKSKSAPLKRSKMVVPNSEANWVRSCAVAGEKLVLMAGYGLSQGKGGLFVLRGFCSKSDHHAILHLIAFVLLDTSEGVVIPGSAERVDMLRELYLTEVRTRLLHVHQDAFPSFFAAHLHKFDSGEKMPANPSKRLGIFRAKMIVQSHGCECEIPWDKPGQMEEPCGDCTHAKDMLLRLGFIVRDNVCHVDSRLMGDWCEYPDSDDEEEDGEDEAMAYSEAGDTDNTVLVEHWGYELPLTTSKYKIGSRQ